MQDPESNQPAKARQESPEVVRLTEELARLKKKRDETNDADIIAVLNMRIKDIEATLPSLMADQHADEDQEEAPESEEIQKLRLELRKLEEKRAQTKDKNIIAVLDMRIMQIQPTLPPPQKPKSAPKAKQSSVSSPNSHGPSKESAELPEPNAPIPLPTPAESDKAEQYVRQSMVEKRRGNAVAATDLLKKAADAAPGSAVVLEALGDDLASRKLMKQAREAYDKARKLDPKNVGLERKYALTVLGSTTTMTVEQQLLYGMSDSFLLTSNDNVAGIWAARFLSVMLPGLGQLVVGRTTKGIVLLSIYVVSFGLIAIWHKDFELLMRYARGAQTPPNFRILIPIIAMVADWFTSLGDLASGQNRESARHTKTDRPKPPVDLPFE
jgi:tetratricopeptide (TPR) repeat protein